MVNDADLLGKIERSGGTISKDFKFARTKTTCLDKWEGTLSYN